MSAPLLKVSHLSRHFGSVRAVNDLSFEIEGGHVYGLIGANGAGKTTTMRILATLDVPDRGTVELEGIDIVEHPEKVRGLLGWMPDHFQPYANTTVREYLDFFARAYGLLDGALLQRVEDVLDFTELRPLEERLIDKLSKGQSQRLCLARTLLNDPRLLILDEPAAGLDPKARLEFKNLVRILRERGKTLLISSHILSELGEMCDSLIFMDAGGLMHQGDTETLQKTQGVDGTLLEIKVDGPVAPLLEWLSVRPGWKLAEQLRDGARASFEREDSAAISAELRRMIVDGLAVAEFKRVERRLEEAFVEMLRPNSQKPSAPTQGRNEK